MYPQEREGDRSDPRQETARAGRLGRRSEVRDVVAAPPQRRRGGAEVDQPALVVDVVADPRREQVKAADRAHDLVLRVHLQEVDERVVLEDHRQARVAAKERLPHVRSGAGETADRDAHRRLTGHPDLDISRAVAGEHRLEASQQEVPELFGHPLAADEGMHLVAGPREPAAVALVEEVLQERRIPRDEEPVVGTQVAERREDLVDVRADGLDDPAAHHPEAHVEAGGPRPHRECVDRHEGLGAEGVAGEEADVPMGDLALAAPADPVVGGAGRAARFVDRRARIWDRTADAPIEEAEPIDVRALVRLGQAPHDAERKQRSAADARVPQEAPVGRNVPHRAPRRSLRAERAAWRAVRNVPAYRRFLRDAGVRGRSLFPLGIMGRLPETDKRTYVDRFGLLDRCVGGSVPYAGTTIDESSGSTGTPYNWIRGRREREVAHRNISFFARYAFGTRPLVTINAFSMGAWATGFNMSLGMMRRGIVKSCLL